MERPYSLMHRAYPLPLEKPSSLTLSCGLGFGFGWKVLAYSLDDFVTFQGISSWFFVSCTGPEEIVPVCTRGSERNNNNNNILKKPGKKKKSREIWWNAPKKILSVIRQKKIFGQAKPYAMRKQKITNKVRDLIISIHVCLHYLQGGNNTGCQR